MKVALDCHVAKAVRKLLAELGHEVVVDAAHGEPDLVWFERARAAGAEAIVSGDRIFAVLCWKAEPKIQWIKLENGAGGEEHQVMRVRAALDAGAAEPPAPGSAERVHAAEVERQRRRRAANPNGPGRPFVPLIPRIPRHTADELARLAEADARRDALAPDGDAISRALTNRCPECQRVRLHGPSCSRAPWNLKPERTG